MSTRGTVWEVFCFNGLRFSINRMLGIWMREAECKQRSPCCLCRHQRSIIGGGGWSCRSIRKWLRRHRIPSGDCAGSKFLVSKDARAAAVRAPGPWCTTVRLSRERVGMMGSTGVGRLERQTVGKSAYFPIDSFSDPTVPSSF